LSKQKQNARSFHRIFIGTSAAATLRIIGLLK